MLKKIIRWFDFLESFFFNIAKIAVIVMMILITFDAFGRYVFNQPIPGGYKLVESYLLVMVVFLSLSYVMKMNGHINVTLLIDRFPYKVKKVIENILLLFALLFILLLAYVSLNQTIEAYQKNLTELGIIEWPVWLVYVWVAIGSVLFIIRILIQIVESIFSRHEEKEMNV